MTETPDCWKFIRLTPHDKSLPSHDRILCSWYGGFMGSDHWKLSSGNQEVINHDYYLEVPQHSGTVYHLYKDRQRWSGYMTSVFNKLKKNAKEVDMESFDYVC